MKKTKKLSCYTRKIRTNSKNQKFGQMEIVEIYEEKIN